MAKGSRNKGFNTAFAQLKQRAPLRPGVQAAKPAPSGRTGAAASAAGLRPADRPPNKLGDRRSNQPADRPGGHDDGALFAAAMRDATPLAASVARVPEPVVPVAAYRPTDDEYALAELAAIVDGSATFRVHASEEEYYGAAPGVNNALLDGLRRGQYAFQLCLDLHGLTREEAHQQIIRFVTQARTREGATCVLIVTGRGRSSPMGTSVLRETLPRWLSRAPVRPHVLAYATARPCDGGPGAYYVLLRRQGVFPFGALP